MACLLVLIAPDALAAERVAVFDPELYDTSGEGPRDDQQKRLAMIGDSLRAALAESGRFEVVDTAPLRARLKEGPSLRTCATCAPDAAAELGADLALLTTVHKVSNLILSITVALREASPGSGTRAVYSAEIRGNTDESWNHGLRWLLRNRLLAPPPPQGIPGAAAR
ncbi:MAG TPA: DUF3280 domain-containing protein [Acetobacteraceae bacterium]|jgi:Protein of unknown function (DUF2380)|nr:DUF3280 domain-containing protein [Acetobacteraceae bacterium]